MRISMTTRRTAGSPGPTAKPAVAAMALVCALCLGMAGCSRETPQSLVESGKAFQARNEHKSAVIQFKSALQRDPTSGETRLLLGQSLLESNEFVNAEVELQKALDSNISKDRVLPLIARAMLSRGGVEKLTSAYGNTQLDEPLAAAKLKVLVATAWAQQKQPRKADAAIEEALRLAPGFQAALTFKARQQGIAGNTAAALVSIEAALKADDRAADAWAAKGEILSRVTSERQGAEAAFRKALEIDPTLLSAHFGMIAFLAGTGDAAGLQAQADKFRAVWPKHPHSWMVDATLALQAGNFPRARELTEKLLLGAPDNVDVLRLAAGLEIESGSLTVAERHLSKALAANPELSSLRRGLALVYLRSSQPSKAMQVLRPELAKPRPDSDILGLAGEAMLRQGDGAAAEGFFRKAAQQSPDDARVQTSLALTQIARGSPGSAFEQLSLISAKSPDVFVDMATFSARLDRREYAAAEQALEVIARKRPNSGQVEELRGRLNLARNDMAGARAAFDKALQLDAKLFAATVSLAALDVIERKPQDAAKRFAAVIQNDPRNMFAHLALFEIRVRGGAGLDELRGILQDAIKASPNDPEPRLKLVVLLSSKRLNKDALNVAQQAATALPTDLRVLDTLGAAQMRGGDEQQAIATFRRIVGMEPKAVLAHLRLADIYRATNNNAAAEASYKRALEIAPDTQAAQFGLISLLKLTKRNADAVNVARSIQTRQPTDPSGWMFEGAVHRSQKAPDLALQAYRNGLTKLPNSTPLAVELHKLLIGEGLVAEAARVATDWTTRHPQDVDFEYHLSEMDVKRGDVVQAEQRLGRVLALSPGHVLALNNMAWALTKQGKPGALAMARRAEAAMPDQAAVVDTLAGALAGERQFAEALIQQRRAIDLSPGDARLKLNLARILVQSGDKSAARVELERLSAAGTAFDQQDEVQKLLKGL